MASQRRAAPPRGRRPRGSPRHMGRGSGRAELAMAGPPGRCPDCAGPERGGGGTPPAVPLLGIAVDEGDVLPGALRLMRELRPSWEPDRVKTKVRPGGVGGAAGNPPGDRPRGLQSPAGGVRSPPEGAVGCTPKCYSVHPVAAIEPTRASL